MTIRTRELVFLLLIQGLFSSSAWPASFNCAATGLTRVEQMICHDAPLSALDSKLASTYDAAKGGLSPTGRANLIATQRAWIKQRNQCSDISCLISAYATRITELSPSAKPAAPTSSTTPGGGSSSSQSTAGDRYKIDPTSVTVNLPDTSYEYNHYVKIHHSIMFAPTGLELKNDALSRIQGKWWIDPPDGTQSVALLDCAAKTKNGAPARDYDLKVLDAACSIHVTVITVAEQQRSAAETENFLTYWKLTDTGVSGGRYVCHYLSKDKQYTQTLIMDNPCPTYQPMISGAP